MEVGNQTDHPSWDPDETSSAAVRPDSPFLPRGFGWIPETETWMHYSSQVVLAEIQIVPHVAWHRNPLDPSGGSHAVKSVFC